MQSHNSTQSPALRPSAAHDAFASSSLATAASPSVKPVKPAAVAAAAASTLAAGFPLNATHGVDGLPLLPSHAQSCEVDPPRALLPLDYDHEAFASCSGVCDHAAVVDVFGVVSSRDAIREKLLRFYQDTKQVVAGVVNAQVDNGEKKSASVEIVGDGISEMTLRIDTELELLRQQCFAERNAQWDYHTPDMFSYEPVREPMWNPLLAGNANIALRRLKYDAALDRDEKEGTANAIAASGGGGNGNTGGASGKKDGKGFPLGEFSRERPWPPREFMQKATTRPSRARGGKRKAPAPIVEQRSVFSKMCVECHTQSTPLWRKIARESTKMKHEEEANGVNYMKSEAGNTKPPIAPVITNGALATTATPSTTAEPNATTATTLPVDQAQLLHTVGQQAEVDVCLECYLKLQRSDIFARKQLERAQKELEKQERIAAEAALEKKRLKQQLQILKKQQQAQAKSKKRKPVPQELVVAPETVQQEPVSEVVTAPTTAIKIVVKTDVVRDDHHVAVFEAQQEELREQKEERDHSKSAKRDKKKSKKDKKKKKKKKRRDDSDDDESDSGTPMPSPPQMVGQYEYADLAGGGLRTSRSASSVTSFDAVVESHNVEYENGPVQQQATATTSAVVEKQEHVIEKHHHEEEQAVAVEESMTTSKRTRKSTSRRDSVTTISTSTATTTTTTAAVSSSKSRKRKNSIVAVSVVEPVVEAQAITSSRSSRSRASSSSSVASAVVPTAAPVPIAAAAVTTPARKRARTKKESARERELRALGQYCPVCNFVYEEDDESSFVCCDSCEMWVHAACDTTLTPALLAALVDTAEKYICPLCAGR